MLPTSGVPLLFRALSIGSGSSCRSLQSLKVVSFPIHSLVNSVNLGFSSLSNLSFWSLPGLKPSCLQTTPTSSSLITFEHATLHVLFLLHISTNPDEAECLNVSLTSKNEQLVSLYSVYVSIFINMRVDITFLL